MAFSNWQETPHNLFFSRNDSEDLRWGDFAKKEFLIKNLSHGLDTGLLIKSTDPISSDQRNQPGQLNNSLGLWGYADDEGIRLNGGRTGASMAPDFIRRFFYRLTSSLTQINGDNFLIDYGNWTKGISLDQQRELISPILAKQLDRHPMITLGGGHDYGAVDGAGFINWSRTGKNQTTTKPLIINFDAHPDVRPWNRGLNSGTPFSWLLDHFSSQFEFLEVGCQLHCSSSHHLNWLQDKKATVLDLNFIRNVGILTALKSVLAGSSPLQNCFISLDIDVFSQSLAPGCSQSWGAGLHYDEISKALSWILKNKNVRLFSIYEVSPPLDSDNTTSKLAACMMDLFVKNYWTKY